MPVYRKYLAQREHENSVIVDLKAGSMGELPPKKAKSPASRKSRRAMTGHLDASRSLQKAPRSTRSVPGFGKRRSQAGSKYSTLKIHDKLRSDSARRTQRSVANSVISSHAQDASAPESSNTKYRLMSLE